MVIRVIKDYKSEKIKHLSEKHLEIKKMLYQIHDSLVEGYAIQDELDPILDVIDELEKMIDNYFRILKKSAMRE